MLGPPVLGNYHIGSTRESFKAILDKPPYRKDSKHAAACVRAGPVTVMGGPTCLLRSIHGLLGVSRE